MALADCCRVPESVAFRGLLASAKECAEETVASKTMAIVGYGAVGGSLASLFPQAVIYDEPKGMGTREDVNACCIAFVCVPTPSREDGSCDTSIVEDVVSWLEADVIVICSTVAVGTTERLKRATGKRIVFQPEYGPSGSPGHPYRDRRSVGWLILGGDRDDTSVVAELFKSGFSSELVIRHTDSCTAELAKYMENAFLALKVTFCNEFYDIAGDFGVDYDELRELWLLDPRMGRSHTFVYPDDRGFGGACLPKDLDALLASAAAQGRAPALLGAVKDANAAFRGSGDRRWPE
jgi:UDPglucose 6-dehydrogenase